MAQRKIITLLDDFDACKGLETLADQTLVLPCVDGSWIEIDLTDDHANEVLAVFAAIATAGRKVKGPRKQGQRRNVGSTDNSNADAEVIRAWARANGYDVKDRGQIPKALREAYEQNRPAPVQVPVQSEIEMPEQPALTLVPGPAEFAEKRSPASMPRQTGGPVFELSAWEKRNPDRRMAGRRIADMTDEERFSQLTAANEKILEKLRAFPEGARAKDVPYLGEPNQRKLLNLGMIDEVADAAGKFVLTKRGECALECAGRL